MNAEFAESKREFAEEDVVFSANSLCNSAYSALNHQSGVHIKFQETV
jgi:hypothetical protein